MQKPLLILATLFMFFSCQKEVIEQNQVEEEIEFVEKTGFLHVDDETNCNGYTHMTPSGDGVTGSFELATTLYLYQPSDFGCNYVRFTGNYNKSTQTLSNVKAHYYKSYIYAGEVRYKYQISSADMWWYKRNGTNEYRLAFNMDKISERGGESDGVNSGWYPNTDPDAGDSTYIPSYSSGADYGVFSVVSEGKYIDFVVE
ncbi:MAG: hypothetical protein HWE22_07705 [Flavobacteriales bacterium]|nr:hypothetical protein [Flavobacteriales bacterium]